jgi:asparagine N-glycosylation enzyme membrane subunit Stt3
MSVARSWLREVRTNRRERWYALAAAAVVGLAAAWVHWYGFVLGGALVGLVSKDAKRGLLAGVGFGLLAWVVFAALLASNGSLGAYLGMRQIFGLSAAIPVVGGVLGSLIRGVV